MRFVCSFSGAKHARLTPFEAVAVWHSDQRCALRNTFTSDARKVPSAEAAHKVRAKRRDGTLNQETGRGGALVLGVAIDRAPTEGAPRVLREQSRRRSGT